MPLTCYGQFALPVCKELDVCKRIAGDRLQRYSQGECPVFDRLDLETDKINRNLRSLFCLPQENRVALPGEINRS